MCVITWEAIFHHEKGSTLLVFAGLWASGLIELNTGYLYGPVGDGSLSSSVTRHGIVRHSNV